MKKVGDMMKTVKFIETKYEDGSPSSPCGKCRTGEHGYNGCRYQSCASWRGWFNLEWRNIQMMYARELEDD